MASKDALGPIYNLLDWFEPFDGGNIYQLPAGVQQHDKTERGTGQVEAA